MKLERLGRDFNEVREAEERFGSHFNERQAMIFNSFISNSSLIDVPSGGYNLTWTDKWGSKMSKLDRFLVSEIFFDTFPHTSGLILEKGRSYHRPILLKQHMVDFGPTPFRFFHSWLELEDRTSHLASIDVKIDQGCDTELDFLNRCESTRILGDIHRLEANDIAQKARIKWALEGDENSSFFHATLKKKRRQLAIKGVLKDEEWIEDPINIKSEFVAHFSKRFHNSNGYPPSFVGDMPNVLTPDQSVCVSDDIVLTKANALGCGAAKMPLKYLGVPVGCNMGRCSNWDAIVQKNSSKLTQWNARLLLVGGHLSLIKSVLESLQTYYMSLYKVHVSICNKLESMRNNFFIDGDLGVKKLACVSWKKCMASKKRGGLGIGNFHVLNAGLLFKWLWRFLNQPLDLWGTVIKEIHGQNGGIFAIPSYSSSFSPWCSILSSVKSLNKKGIDLLSLCNRKLGNNVSISFWNDVWCGNLPLKTRFPRVYMLDNDKSCSIANRLALHDWSAILRRHPRGGIESALFSDLLQLAGSVVLTEHNDSWKWSLDISKGFSVASARFLIDSHTLDTGSSATRWNNNIPIKVNVFLWRLTFNKLPTKINFDRKCIDVDSLLCPICLKDVETVNHTFFNCDMAKDLWALLSRCYADDEFDVGDDNNVTLISILYVSNPLHLHPNDSVALTIVSVKLKGTENYQVWSCAMLLALEGKNKTGFIDGSCKRSNTDEVLGSNGIESTLWSSILSRETLPDVRSAYAIISSKESYRVASGSLSGTS
ncbi:RNA-directed DNA polymerase, eukaryota, reverse transcriptase zinc-binding domain protein [Tanacetum coccineum]